MKTSGGLGKKTAGNKTGTGEAIRAPCPYCKDGTGDQESAAFRNHSGAVYSDGVYCTLYKSAAPQLYARFIPGIYDAGSTAWTGAQYSIGAGLPDPL